DNPQTDDGADVINLSLGGQGEADDPVCQAVDNAVDAGVLVVVSAGNDGSNGYMTVSSPGLAQKALTVAASDKSDQIAWFSSRGPGSGLDIKPDIAAPGVNILSCQMGGGSVAYNGTSMSAPHVAGAAALLLQGRPGLSSLEAKQLLMGNARNIDFNVFTRGSGRLDIYKTLKSNTLVSPASLSLGYDDQSQTLWSKTEKVTIRNLGNDPSAYFYSVTLESSLPPGITVEFPAQIQLDAQTRSAVFDFKLSVNNNLVPDVAEDPHAYEGTLVFTNGSDTFRAPFAFVKAPVLQMTFDRAPMYIIIHNNSNWSTTILPHKATYTALLPAKGNYDVIGFFINPYQIVVKEKVLIDNRTTLAISSSEAVHQMTFNLVDHQNQPLTGDLIWMLKTPAGFGAGMNERLQFPPAFSEVSADYVLDWTVFDFWSNQAVSHQIADQVTGGIHASMDFSNTPAEYTPVEFTYEVDPEIEELFVLHFPCRPAIDSMNPVFISGLNEPSLKRDQNGEFKRTLYVRPIRNTNFYFSLMREDIYKYQGPYFDNDEVLILRTPYYLLEKDRPLRAYLGFDWSNPVFESSDRRIRCGLGPHYWSARMWNASDEIRLYPSRGNRNYFYISPLGDFAPNTGLAYFLYNEAGQLIKNASFPWAGGIGEGSYEAIPLPAPGLYRLTIPYADYFVNGSTGQAVTQLLFDTRRSDANPPFMQNFKILSGGKESNVLNSAASNETTFDLLDDQAVSNVVLWLKAEADAEWQVVPLGNAAGHYSALINHLSKTGFYSLRIVAADESGNWLDTLMDRAFYYTVQKLKIAGTVTYNGMPLADVVLKGLPGEPKTDGAGQYNASVDPNWTGLVTPTLDGFIFTPANKTYAGIATDQINQNYTGKSADGVEILTNGRTLSGLSASKGKWLYYKIKVPAGANNFTVKTWGGSGDADLYLKFASKPTTSNNQYRSTGGTNNETCAVTSVTSGGFCYIGIYAYKAFSGLTLTVGYQ
ncbi:MAG: hypothetical protein EHM45_17635, partial [Desulfobacteraceae bacterium]